MKLNLPDKLKMKVPLIAVLCILVLGGGLFYSYTVSDARVDASGVIIKTDTPENTVKTYYELVFKNRYEPAAALQTKKSQTVIKAGDIEAQQKQVRMTSASLTKVFKAETQKDLAVVGDIRLARFPGNNYDSAIVGVTVLSNGNNKNKWEIVNSLEEVGQENYLTLLELIIKLDGKMAEENLDGSGFSDPQKKMIAQQIQGMQKFHKEQLDEYKKYLKDINQKKQTEKK